MSARTCEHCGARLGADAHFCTGWADAAPRPAHELAACPACRATLRAGARFCTRCGGAADGGPRHAARARRRPAWARVLSVLGAVAAGGGLGAWIGSAGGGPTSTSGARRPGAPSLSPSAPAPTDPRSLTARIEAIAREHAPGAPKAVAPEDLVGSWAGRVVAIERTKNGVAVPGDASGAPPMDFRIAASGGQVELVPQGPGLSRRVLESRDGRVVGRGEPPLSLELGLGGTLVGIATNKGWRIEFHATRAR